MLTRSEVVKRINAYNELLSKEKALKEEIMALKLYGSRDHVREARKRHDEILAEIEDIRMNKMIPILKDLSEYVSACEAQK